MRALATTLLFVLWLLLCGHAPAQPHAQATPLHITQAEAARGQWHDSAPPPQRMGTGHAAGPVAVPLARA